MARKLKHKPKTFMGVKDSILLFGSPNLSNNEEVRIYPAAQTLFSIQPIGRSVSFQCGIDIFSFFIHLQTIPIVASTQVQGNSQDISNIHKQEVPDMTIIKGMKFPLTSLSFN